jgi:Fe-coproporphyrin III synthase
MINLTTLLGEREPAADDVRYGRQLAGVHRPVVVWTATRRCNLLCRHCYSASLDHVYPGELTTAEAEAFVDDLTAMGAARLLISGGEPLLRSDVLGVARRAETGGLQVTLSTNGTLLADPAVADGVTDAGFSYVGVSFDGLGATHDAFRGKTGAFDASVRGVRNLVERGQRIGLRLTLTTTTAPTLEDVFGFIEREGFARACFYHLAPAGRGRKAASEALTATQTRAAVDEIIAFADRLRRQRADIEVLTVANAADGPHLLRWLEARGRPTREVRARLRRGGGNRSGIALGHVSNTGEVHPDQFSWQTRLGNIRQRPFSMLWTDATGVLAELRDRRSRLAGRCATCRYLDVCGGNLRMRAAVAGAGEWAEDPGCYLDHADTAA